MNSDYFYLQDDLFIERKKTQSINS